MVIAMAKDTNSLRYWAEHSRKPVQGISTLPGQIDLPDCPHEPSRLLLQQRAAAPLKPAKAQAPCDHGLFSDTAAQLDLVEMLQTPTNEE